MFTKKTDESAAAQATQEIDSAKQAKPTHNIAKTAILWVLNAGILIFYVYAVIAAVGNIVGMHRIADSLGTGLTVTGWAWLVAGILLPIIVCVLALLMARRKANMRPVLLLAGLAVVACWQIEIMYLVPQGLYFQGITV